jgi:hypothetical protein
MTAQSRDGTGTEFSHWLRVQPELDSKLSKFITTNIDFLWMNYESGLWMLIEEKRHKNWPIYPQTKIFESLHKAINHSHYRGFHYVIFENTSPEDGEIYLKNNFGTTMTITRTELIDFLNFKF